MRSATEERRFENDRTLTRRSTGPRNAVSVHTVSPYDGPQGRLGVVEANPCHLSVTCPSRGAQRRVAGTCHVTRSLRWIGLNWLRWLVASAAVHQKGKRSAAPASGKEKTFLVASQSEAQKEGGRGRTQGRTGNFDTHRTAGLFRLLKEKKLRDMFEGNRSARECSET